MKVPEDEQQPSSATQPTSSSADKSATAEITLEPRREVIIDQLLMTSVAESQQDVPATVSRSVSFRQDPSGKIIATA